MQSYFVAVFAVVAFLSSSLCAQESPSIQLFQDEAAKLTQEQEKLADLTAPAQELKASTEEDLEGSTPFEVDSAQLQLIVNVEIASREAGIIQSIGFVEGNEIKVGDVIVNLDKEQEFANEKSARSELDIAKEESNNDIDLRFAKVSVDVNRKVYQRSLNARKQFAKSVSKTELESLKLELERSRLSGEQAEKTAAVSELTVELRKAQLELARVRLESRQIKSPVSGVVVEVRRQVGEWVQAGQPIARVIDLKKLRVSCNCPLEKASPEAIAKKAIFVYEGNEYEAKVVFASPEIDPNVRDFIVLAEVENPNGVLKPGMGGSIKLRAKKK